MSADLTARCLGCRIQGGEIEGNVLTPCACADLTDAEREALAGVLADEAGSVLWLALQRAVARIKADAVARAINEALTEAADAIEARTGRDADYDDGMYDAADIVRARRT